MLFRFAEAMAADPELDPGKAAIAVGRPGQGGVMLKDSRTLKVLSVMLADNRETFKDLRRATIQMLAQLACYDPIDAFDQFGQIRRIDEMPPEMRMAVKSYEVKADGSRRISWVDRTRVLELLLAHFGDIDSRAYAPTGQATVVFRGRLAR